MQKGAKVRFTASRLPLVERPDSAGITGFTGDVGVAGDEGTYFGPHPNELLAAHDWHMVRVEMAGRVLFAPVHVSQFVVVGG